MKKFLKWTGAVLFLLAVGVGLYQWQAFKKSEESYVIQWENFQFTLPAGWTIHEEDGDRFVLDVLPTLNLLTPFKEDYLPLDFYESDIDPGDLTGENDTESSLMNPSSFYLKSSSADNGMQFYIDTKTGDSKGLTYWIYNDMVYYFFADVPEAYFEEPPPTGGFAYPYPKYEEDYKKFLDSFEILE